MEDKDTELLSRVAANHLFLAQFEPFRAILLSLRARNPDLSRAILQTIVRPRRPLRHYIWSFDPDALRLRVEFLLLVQTISSRVSESIREFIDLEGIEKDVDKLESQDLRAELIAENEELKELNSGLTESLLVLDRILELGLNRLTPNQRVSERSSGDIALLEEAEFMGLRRVILENADLLDALCGNIQKQVQWVEHDDSGLAITLQKEEKQSKEDEKLLKLIQRSVQIAHLDAMKECLKESDVEGVVSHICFLHLDYGVEENEYRSVLQDLLRRVLSEKSKYGDNWFTMRDKLLLIYGEALSSNCRHLVQMIQVIHDELLSEEIEMYRASDNNQIPPPLEHLQNFIAEANLDDKTSSLNMAICSCMRDMYHYARVSGLHVLECVMDTALSAVKREQLQEASNVLSLFPRLQPLVAVMGWDLLSGKTTARRKLMQLLWTSKSQILRLEEPSLYGNQTDEVSCVEHLCDSLCYQLDLASFVACVNSGQSWSSKSSLLLSGKEPIMHRNEDAYWDPFVENFVLERLSVQSPLRVLFDVVPGIKFQDAIELISLQPITSTIAAWKRMQDVEFMHMRYALEFTVLALGAMESSMSDETGSHHQMAFCYLKDLRKHLEAISNIPRKILMVNIIISLLHMDDLSLNLTHCASPGSHSELSNMCTGEHEDPATCEGGNKIVVSFTGLLLDILHQNLPSAVFEQENALNGNITTGGIQALEWRISKAKRFIEDWAWRLSILQRLLPLSERQWRWKEALTVLRAAPSKLLNLCMQRAEYDIGEEAVHRFSLPPEDKATLELAEWVDGAFRRASVEDAVSRAADGSSAVQELDFSSLRSQLGPLAAILLCIDVAATSAKSAIMSQRLLDQAQVMLSEIYPGGSPKMGSTYWDQIHEVGIISVTRRVLKHLHELLEQDKPPTLQAILSGEIIISSSKEFYRQGHRERALAILHQMIEDAHKGKRQFLSGKLHNLARAVADEETERDYMKGEGSYPDTKVLLNYEKDRVLGLGLRAIKQKSISAAAGENNVQPAGYDVKDTGKRLFGSLSSKLTTYLSLFILHIAAIGDIVDGTDTTHDFNYFSLVYEWPKDLLTRLVFERGSTDAAEKVAEIMCSDFVHEVISACVPPVYPPRTGHGWACIPVIPTCPTSCPENKVLSPSSREAKPNSYSRSSATPGIPLYPLQLDIVKHLVKLSPVRAVLACVFGSSILYHGSDSTISGSLNDGLLQTPDADRLFYEFALDQSERFPTLNRWIQMQTNLHRVSEFAVTDENATEDGMAALPELNNQGNATSDPWHESPKSEFAELDTTVFLSFDWENEGPYEKAVERLIDEGKLMDALALSDRFLRNGVSDQDKQLAARLALKYLHRWELDAALDVLTMCSCHLPESDPVKNEVVQMRQALLRYNHILCADDHYSSWQEVEAECKEDPEGLALRLAGKGAVSAALEVAESAGLSIDLRRELQGRQLVKLLTADPLNGGGPAEASRFLSSLRDTDDALPVAMGAMQLLPNLRSKQLLVHFFLKRRDGNLSDVEVSRLNSVGFRSSCFGCLTIAMAAEMFFPA
ncbi:hypothetical protein F0562_007171 [Nyssa sinensis]|uniref:Uncharacterized protein n=1 Tax=Nyssa sinensis TaxID=561372 RepID=A0A5J5A5P1_9ASTE|nr:hypothetical protein F0562_007171 [Nyssa sinensis]